METAAATQEGPLSYQARFWPLALMTTISLIGLPVSYQLLGSMGLLLVNSLLWCAAAFAIGRSGKLLAIGIGATVGITVLEGLLVYGDTRHTVLAVIFHLAAIAFIVGIIVYILIVMMRMTVVTGDTVLGGICAYLLLGVLFAFLYSMCEVLEPGSFRVPDDIGTGMAMTWTPHEDARELPDHLSGQSHLLYFSFTTLTTLGYGDVVPRTMAARSLTTIEALLGQLFIAVLIARLVATATIASRRPTAEPPRG